VVALCLCNGREWAVGHDVRHHASHPVYDRVCVCDCVCVCVCVCACVCVCVCVSLVILLNRRRHRTSQMSLPGVCIQAQIGNLRFGKNLYKKAKRKKYDGRAHVYI